MAGALNKVRSGDPLVIPAAAYNAFVDAAMDHRRRQRSSQQQADREFRQAGIVPIRNETGQDQPRFAILGIAGPIIERADNAEAFKERVALRGVVPTADHVARFGVLLAPVVGGEVGPACVDGVCIAKVQMADEGHRFAEALPSQTAMLRSAYAGSAGLLWIEPIEDREETTIAWAVVRIGSAGGSASGSASLGYCQIESSIGTTPPFIYTARRVPALGNGQFGPPEGADFDLWNLAEIGAGGTGVHEVPDGAIVAFWQDADSGAYFFDRSFYRGTY